MTSSGDMGRWDPFEDTGDWPFRDAPPRPESPVTAEEEPREVSPRGINEDTALEASIVEPEPEPEAEPESAPEPGDAEEPEPEAEPGPDELSPEAFTPEAVPPGAVAPEAVPPEVFAPEAVAAELEEASPAEAAHEAAVVVAGVASTAEHAPGTLAIPPGLDVLEGGPHGFRRNVAVVVSRFNGDITTGLLESAVSALRDCNVQDDAITVVPVPGAFELPLTALALAKTRRFSCVVALGCIIRGETPHFDLIASEAASGLQLAAIETGIPVAFGVIATETREQAEARVDRGAEAAQTALEMADLFSHVRTRAAGA
jgi:6,7-dimethyl-8-ribityllumazine synthase